MSASAGKVLLMPKGDYNSATAYSVLDWVRYQGASYVCKQASQGNLPTNTTYWSLLVQDGLSEDPNAYHTTDTAETTLDDADYLPFYDTSATAKRKTLWSNIKSVLKTYFDTLYATVSSLASKAEISSIGTNETGTTARRAYAVGEHFYKNGKFCTAKATITQGATFTLGTNYVEGSIADLFDEMNYSTAGLNFSNSGCTLVSGGYVKIGKMVFINMRINVTATTGIFRIGPFPVYTNRTVSNKVLAIQPFITSNSVLMNFYMSSDGYLNCPKSIGNVEAVINMHYLCD